MPLNTAARRFPDNTNAPAIATVYPQVSLSDLRYASVQEQVHALDDLMFRRVRLGWSEGMGCDVAGDVARTVRADLGWSVAEADAQAQRYVAETRRIFGLRMQAP